MRRKKFYVVDAGSIYSDVRIKLDKLTSDIASINSSFDNLVSKNKTQADQIGKNWKESTDKGKEGFEGLKLEGVLAFALIADAMKETVKSFTEFEESMQRNRSVMTGSEQDFAALEQAALKTGASTEFSAKQSSDALYVFAKAGFDASTSIKLLDSSQLLAKASGDDLAQTAQVLKLTMSQFNLGADSADRIANLFAAAKMPVQELSDSLRTVGPIAAGMNISIEETVAVLKKLSASGMEGQAAGASLRLVMAGLSDSTSALVKNLKQYGITFDKINPQTHSFAEIIGVLGKAGITSADSLAIFGARAGTAMATLIKQGQSAIEDYTKSITGTSEAAKMAEILDNSLGDATQTMGNAFQVAGIQIMKELAPALRFIVDIVTKAVQWFTELPAPVKIFVGVVGAGIPIIMGINAAIGILGGLLGAAALPIAGVVAGFGLIIAVGAGLASQLHDTSKEWKNQKDWIDANTKSIEDFKKIGFINPKEGKQSAAELKQAIADINKQAELLKKQIDELNKTPIGNEKFELDFNMSTTRPGTTDQKQEIVDTAKKIELGNELNQLLLERDNLYLQLSDQQKKEQGISEHLTSEQLKANEDLEKSIKSYQAKLEDLGATDLMIIENERNRALASIAASGATAAEQDKANRKLNEYYDALVKTTQKQEKYANVVVGAEADTTDAIKQTNEELEKQKKELEKVTESVEKGLIGALQGVASLFSAVYDQRMKDLDNEMYAEEKAAGVLQDTAVQTADKNLAKAKEGNNAEIIADAEKALKRAQIEEAYEKKKAQSAYEAAKIQWGLQLSLATALGVVSVLNAFSTFPFAVGLAAGIAQTIESGIQIASIYAAEPKAPSFHSGGVYDAAPEGTAILKRGEMTLTTEQQAGLWNFIKSGSSGGRGDININNQFGDVNSDVDIERYNKTLAKQIQAVMHT
jgi:TP901 family phage tail tape measure protein